VLLLLAAVVTDIRFRRISNRLILAGLGMGLLFQIWESGARGFFLFLLQMFFPVIVLYLLFLMHALGAGDIKLFSVVGSIWNLKVVVGCMLFSFVAGAVISLGKLLYHKNLKTRLQYFCRYLQLSIGTKTLGIYDRDISGKEKVIHFSFAILIGFFITVGVMV
jgi:prepilin peptidase CpaA